FLLTRLLANMGVAGSTELLDRFSTPVGGSDGTTVVKNGDFSADDDGMPDDWIFTPSEGATCRRERNPEDSKAWSLVLTCPPVEGDKRPTVMLAQHDVPVKKDQWYRISFQARAERLVAESVSMTITNMATWRSFFEYQRFVPGPQWKRFSFEVQSNDTADRQTRFQIWYGDAGKLWLRDVRMVPIAAPTEGRWLEGLYLDVPEQWDDPYRFFRW
ncbi:MAG: carbohydrate binding domain-containing protein, partial [Candidatus Nealsonbacteria bacterium]|nr:carbohydrate binding domain-containing protein [Candidatus Nealsonbacteria bacterium]